MKSSGRAEHGVRFFPADKVRSADRGPCRQGVVLEKPFCRRALKGSKPVDQHRFLKDSFVGLAQELNIFFCVIGVKILDSSGPGLDDLHPVAVKEIQFAASSVCDVRPFSQPRVILADLEFAELIAVYENRFH